MTAPVLAALAAQPRRVRELDVTLRSLRPQVDRIHVYLNGWDWVPDCVLQLADDHVVDRTNHGAERKFWWSESWNGVYLSCDDDIQYPPDYVERMLEAIAQRGRALVSCHGRVYEGRPLSVQHPRIGSVGLYHRRVDEARPINHCGTGVMGWDSRLVRVPATWPRRNVADMQVAVWAQQARVPMWLLAHPSNWLRSETMRDPDSIWRQSQAQGHARRNQLLKEHPLWQVYS